MAQNVSWTPLIVLVVVVIIAAGATAGYFYVRNKPGASAGPRLVQVGDNVTVNYIGIFGSGPEAGRVFDTSIYSVGSNTAAYPKSLGFHDRGVAKNYTALDVHVGPNTPSSGFTLGGLNFIGVVPGFWQGLVGIPPNQTRSVSVPSALGYGAKNPSCIATQPLTVQLPVVVTMPGTAFAKAYPGALAATGSEFSDPHYGWNVLVLSANSSYVTIENLPFTGETSSPAGWPLQVTSVSSTANGTGQITLVNELTPAQAGFVLGKDFLGTGPCTSQARGQFIVTGVDLLHGTYTEDYNQEVVGQTLIFVVSIVDDFPGTGR